MKPNYARISVAIQLPCEPKSPCFTAMLVDLGAPYCLEAPFRCPCILSELLFRSSGDDFRGGKAAFIIDASNACARRSEQGSSKLMCAHADNCISTCHSSSSFVSLSFLDLRNESDVAYALGRIVHARVCSGNLAVVLGSDVCTWLIPSAINECVSLSFTLDASISKCLLSLPCAECFPRLLLENHTVCLADEQIGAVPSVSPALPCKPVAGTQPPATVNVTIVSTNGKELAVKVIPGTTIRAAFFD